MFLEVMTATLIAANVQTGNYHPVKYEPAQVEFKIEKPAEKISGNSENASGYSYKIQLPADNKTKYTDYQQFVNESSERAKRTIRDVKKRSTQSGQFLKWIYLPEKQLEIAADGKSHLDSVYEQANILASRKGDTERPLVVLGIGGSKHTAEFLLNMTGLKHDRKIYFYSDIDPVSYENFIEQLDCSIADLNFLVVSKSGTTFETKDAFLRFEKALINYYKKEGFSETEAIKNAQSHFAICTDATPTEKNLRGRIGNKNGENNNYIKELYIHDDVGGRFSMFDDACLFVLAYAGESKDKTRRILEAAKNITQANLSEDVKNNPGVQGAIFNLFADQGQYCAVIQQYFGRLFEGAGENWSKQLYMESVKRFDFLAGKAPDSMHYASEAHYAPWNRNRYRTVLTIMNPSISENYRKYVFAIQKTYAETTPVKLEILDVEDDAIKPEAIGEYVQSKHFETIYTWSIEDEMFGYSAPAMPVMDCVVQPSVEIYKNKFKPGSPYELAPGE